MITSKSQTLSTNVGVIFLTQIYNDFFTLIKQNPDFTEFEFEGEGRIPYPETTSGNWVNHPSRFFKYKGCSGV